MTFRDRMKVRVSTAELDIFVELQRRDLTTGLTTQVGYPLDLEKDKVGGTFIDFYWKALSYAVFIDGGLTAKHGFQKLHLRQRQEIRDEHVTAALVRRGLTVGRYPYVPPLRKWRRVEICDSIQNRLITLGYAPVGATYQGDTSTISAFESV